MSHDWNGVWDAMDLNCSCEWARFNSMCLKINRLFCLREADLDPDPIRRFQSWFLTVPGGRS
jgi:hypothetical protein